MLTACGGDDGDNVVITPPQPTPSPSSDPTAPGDCGSAVQASFVSFNQDCSVGTLSGVVNQDYTLDAERMWQLRGEVVVGQGNGTVANADDVQKIKDAGVTLTIDAGVEVKAYDDGALIVTRGSKLMAEGTASDPITFSSLDSNYDGLGEWGGVIVQGFAPQYGQGGTGVCHKDSTWCNIEGEGGTVVGLYGGNEEDDNSGVIKYVRIAEGGKIAGPDNEINGLTLQGVGHGTTVEYVQVHGNLDDGIEWFGGTVNAKYLVLTNNDDDDIDFDEGYMGNIQYAIVQKDPLAVAPQGKNDPRGIEANSSDKDFVSETTAVIANVTIVGSEVNKAANSKGDGLQPGMRLRGGLTVEIVNSAVTNFDDCVRVDDVDADEKPDTGDADGKEFYSTVTLTNVAGACDDKFYAKRAADNESGVMQNAPFSLSPTYAIQEEFAKLDSAVAITPVANGSSFSFDSTDFIGAVDPASTSAWWQGWTLPGTLGAKPKETGFATCNDEMTQCTLQGTVDENYTLVSGVEYLLRGEVLVGSGNVAISSADGVARIKEEGVTLSIQPGVHIRGYDDGSLLVTRGSKLNAIGTKTAPITFSSLDNGYDGLGEWGGVIIQGFAPQYGQRATGACWGENTWCNVEGEGGTVVGNYGGNEPADNSGTIQYVRIAEGGKIAGPDNEINGLTLQGVGHGTTIEYVQVHNNLDDGVEWFGGTVNAKYLVLTGNDDDDIDFDEGYMGNIQYAIIVKDQDATAPQGKNDPRGIEANSSDSEYAPETRGVLANILIWGSEVNKAENSKGDGKQPGMRLRGGLTASVYNTAVKNFDDCVRIDDVDADDKPETGDANGKEAYSNVTLVNILGECDDKLHAKGRVADSETNVQGPGASVTVDAAYALTDAAAQVTEVTPTAYDNGSGFTFDATDYVGAVAPGTAANEAWWAGWTIEGSL
ncbi:hypothetical protein [Agaribacterium haliotis]|uniref:hypothetical protein n=1 Tax=Agaribacterium haliotis TaxID=2013869 RepID=UPI001EFD4B8C|nr:hypothetical protein [Agaribacterium haliotis]